MTELIISNLTRRYGSVNAIDNINITVAAGEFLTLLGPSGCGKSTTLAAIAGLDQPTHGRISFAGRTLFDADTKTALPPEARGFGVVFQSYALWPHMSVEDNVGLSLRLRKTETAERIRRVGEALELVGLTAYAKRYPGELSGGQQQRVALARAVVFRPSLLLLDEPLSNLDAQLRQEARVWLKNIQRELGLTAIYVTHDQEEALSMSDRIVVMRGGKIVQMGTPQDIYERPVHPFSASFIGSANLMAGGTVTKTSSGEAVVAFPDGQTLRGSTPLPVDQGASALVAVRPQNIRVTGAAEENQLTVRFGPANYLGDRFEQEAFFGDCRLRLQTDRPAPEGQGSIWINSQDVLIFPPDERAKDKT